ncbi:flagellar protein FlgN [endosymbiont of Ridgeia piscesae]|jgi:flagellar biosynthesis/type III secretory pathway chaperone|uniref:Flagella synthesis protein FlgN n=1 Tax=endosymbiont of Ridgeia piscesae TaxID=54398 RepID=A0A0T5Z0E8_9GAMM|nr:flagellar protein FlgN [endosymbiont of Ridgeia piscesae]KRT56304.1 FlgN protein [endosymbiont of Ridgeia piscesae]KRT58818.1 flagella synthesis protein FlgN [endosymbiont of Ridgeia piscesae]
MDNHPKLRERFSRILQRESEATEQLLVLLKQEYALLKSTAPAEQLEALNQQKEQQIINVAQAVEAHNRLLRELGLNNNGEETRKLIEQLDGSGLLQQQWQTFLKQVDASQKQNGINGGLLTLSQRQAAQGLDILRGIGENQKSYGPSGESRSHSHSHSLGKA